MDLPNVNGDEEEVQSLPVMLPVVHSSSPRSPSPRDVLTMASSPTSLTRLGINRQDTRTGLALEDTHSAFEQGKLFQATEKKMEQVWNGVDTNQSNNIGVDEVEHLLRRYFEVSVKVMYKSLKANPEPIPVEGVFAELLGLASISPGNVHKVMAIFNDNPQAFVDLTMEKIDVDGDGRIEKWEFLKEGAKFFFGSQQFLGRVYKNRSQEELSMEELGNLDSYGFQKRDSFINKSLKEVPDISDAHPIWEQLCSWKTVYNASLEEEAKEQVWDGIPAEFRGKVWMKITETDMKIDSDYYEFLKGKPAHDKSAAIIAKDVSRSFPDHFLFAAEHGKGQVALSNVLAAYSIHDIELEYCQGMAFLVGTFLMHISELESFWLLDTMFSSKLYNLRHIFMNGFPGLKLLTYEYQVLLANRLPRVYKLFEENQIPIDYYLPDWYMSLFTRHILPWDLVMRVWDCMMLFGDVVLHKTALAILTALESELLSQEDDMAIVTILKPLHPHIVSRASEVVRYMKEIQITEKERQIMQDLYVNGVPVADAAVTVRKRTRSVGRFVSSITSKFRRRTSSKTGETSPKSQGTKPKARFRLFSWDSKRGDPGKEENSAKDANGEEETSKIGESTEFPRAV